MTHSEYEDLRELVRGEMQTPLFKRSMRLRRGIERLFADAKGKRGLTRPTIGQPTHAYWGASIDDA